MASPITHLQVAGPAPENRSAAQMPDGSIRTPTSFGDYGIPDDLVGSAFDPGSLFHSQRSAELRFRASYFHCTQHNGKKYDWEGNAAGPAESRTTQPFIGSSSPSQFIPLRLRRPAVPYRLGRKVVHAFTDFLFGHGRWPQMRSKDAKTQASAEQLLKSGDVACRAMEARNLGGACGTAGLSWRFVDGLPVVCAHSGSLIHVVSWVDENTHVPAHVIELKQKVRLAVDPDDGVLKPTSFWIRRDWTCAADVAFEPARVVTKEPIVWRVDEAESRVHGDGFCHFVWVQNRPSEDESEDGTPDYAETYEQQDGLDVLNSTNYKGVNLNLDPTLAISVSEDENSFTTIRKGSENALVLKAPGRAEYLQLNDTEIGERTINLQRGQILEVVGCVLPDSDKVAAAASSGEALRIVYAPMIGATDFLRMQWGPAVARLVNQMLRSWRSLRATPVLSQLPANDVEVLDEATGEPVEVEPEYEERDQDLMLPALQVREPGPDGKEVVRDEPQDPGSGDVDVEWGPYFKPSGDEKQKVTGAVGTATGGKPVLSQRTGVELVANLYDRDAADEWQAVQAEAEAAAENERLMLDPQQRGAAPVAGASVEIAPTDGVLVMKVNEVRKTMGQGPLLLPDGSPDPDGLISFVAYKAKMEAQQQVEGTAEGKENVGLPPTAPAPSPSPEPDDDLPVPAPRKLPGMGD